MEEIIQITEIHLPDKFADQLKISGTSNEEKALKAAIEWAEENNCLVTSVTFVEEEIHFVAMVCSDDYQ